jgi:hypothetical protein
MKFVSLTKICLNKKYTEVRIGKNLSNMFPIPNGLKEDVLMPMLFNFAFEYAITKVQENR